MMSSASCEIYRYPEAETSRLFATLMSYQGQFRHASSFRLWAQLLNEFPWLRFYVRRSGKQWIRKDRTQSDLPFWPCSTSGSREDSGIV